jgi:hypothetical protein
VEVARRPLGEIPEGRCAVRHNDNDNNSNAVRGGVFVVAVEKKNLLKYSVVVVFV